jgi:hypothetical protein
MIVGYVKAMRWPGSAAPSRATGVDKRIDPNYKQQILGRHHPDTVTLLKAPNRLQIKNLETGI